MDNFETEFEEAKKLYNQKEYFASANKCKSLWENSNKNNHNLLAEYGKALRKDNRQEEFLEIYKELKKESYLRENKYILSVLCWCIYDLYIKTYEYNNEEDLKLFLKYAIFIIKNCDQMDGKTHFYNPYVITVRKVIKTYRKMNNSNYKEIIKWLTTLNPDILSDEVFIISDETGKDREQASLKEFYYSNITRAYEKLGDYDNCIIYCNKALETIEGKFHHNNKVWITARLYYCKCMIEEDNVKAIENYKRLAESEKHWYMYHKLSQILLQFSMPEESLFYACKSFNCRFEGQSMVNLMQDLGNLWLNQKNDRASAKKFFQASAYYRKENDWNFSEDLEYAISSLDIDITLKPNSWDLKKITKKYVGEIENNENWYYGIVKSLLPSGRDGFIKQFAEKENIYFRKADLTDLTIYKERKKVKYQKSTDTKNRPIAINIRESN